MGFQKLGQPVPESNFVAESKSALSQSIQRYKPGACPLSSAPLNAHSVAARRVTSYCSGLNCFFHCSFVLVILGRVTAASRAPLFAYFMMVTGPEPALVGVGSSFANAAINTRCTPINKP